jgi:hypothetical protein
VTKPQDPAVVVTSRVVFAVKGNKVTHNDAVSPFVQQQSTDTADLPIHHESRNPFPRGRHCQQTASTGLVVDERRAGYNVMSSCSCSINNNNNNKIITRQAVVVVDARRVPGRGRRRFDSRVKIGATPSAAASSSSVSTWRGFGIVGDEGGASATIQQPVYSPPLGAPKRRAWYIPSACHIRRTRRTEKPTYRDVRARTSYATEGWPLPLRA